MVSSASSVRASSSSVLSSEILVIVSVGPPKVDPPFQPATPIPAPGLVSAGAVKDDCDAYAQTILAIRQDIPPRELKVAALEALVAAQQQRPAGPDPELLSALRREKDLLESDIGSLRAFTEEFTAHCEPRPDI